MKRFFRGVGLALLYFGAVYGGISLLAFIGTLFHMLGHAKDVRAFAIMIGFAAFCCGIGWLLVKHCKVEPRKKKSMPGMTYLNAENPASDRLTGALPKAPEASAPISVPEAAPEKETADTPADTALCTIISPYLALPFHDGDRFYLFESEAAARTFIQTFGKPGLTVRMLPEGVITREISEYLCCGYTGAILKKEPGEAFPTARDEIIEEPALRERFGVPPQERFGHVMPKTLNRMHNYLFQLDYTYRKYPDGVPEFWHKHLEEYKGDVILRLLASSLCLPASPSNSKTGNFIISIPTARTPSGHAYAALFTDQFAIDRYMGKGYNSVVLPSLLSDVGGQLRRGELKNAEAIMINPGREEFKITVEEIAAQEEALGSDMVKRNLYRE